MGVAIDQREALIAAVRAQVEKEKAPAKLKIYSINGVKVAEVNKVSDAEYVLAPGMYICNGKKFVIK
jgi:hypothetical protein